MTWTAFLIVLGATGNFPAPVLLDAAEYAGSQLPAPFPVDDWLGLCRAKRGYEVKRVGIRLRPFQDIMSGDEGDQKTGRRVLVTGCPRPRALFHAFSFKQGPVQSARVEKNAATLGAATVSLEEKPGSEEFAPGQVWARDGDVFALLFENSNAGPSTYRIKWAGDLDNDGHVDLLLEQDDDGTRLWLFLSSTRQSRTKWEAAGVTYFGGC